MLAILNMLGIPQSTPSLDYLNQILDAWARHIPWETASRVARHQDPLPLENYAWTSERFFENSLAHHTGGTCFETNFALADLLESLGFSVTRHFCDMEGEKPNPHCALIVTIDGIRYMTDMGLPITAALPLDDQQSTSVTMPAYVYTAIPVAKNRWEIHRTSGDFHQIACWLKGKAISRDELHQRIIADHRPDGLFLNTVVIMKVFGNEIWRYSPEKGLVKRGIGTEEAFGLSEEELASLPATLSRIFGMNEAIITRALLAIQAQPS